MDEWLNLSEQRWVNISERHGLDLKHHGLGSEPKISQAEIEALRKPVEEAKALAEKARAVVAHVNGAYRAALAPHR